jgi:nuclear GTP-binding protein
LIALLRQFAILHSDRKQVSVGFIGYPNVGKSSIINTLRKKMVCKTAPIPGETKVWQYITLTRRIYLIDCPGIVPPNPTDTDEELLLRGVVRVENVENPAQYMATMLGRCQERHIERTYGIKGWKNDEEFLEMLARKSGRLLKGGEADLDMAARMVLKDFLRGKVPWYVPPPRLAQDGEDSGPLEGRLGRLGEMTVGVKRKRGDEEETNVGTEADSEEFGGFDENDVDEDDFSDIPPSDEEGEAEVEEAISDGSDPGGS